MKNDLSTCNLSSIHLFSAFNIKYLVWKQNYDSVWPYPDLIYFHYPMFYRIVFHFRNSLLYSLIPKNINSDVQIKLLSQFQQDFFVTTIYRGDSTQNTGSSAPRVVIHRGNNEGSNFKLRGEDSWSRTKESDAPPIILPPRLAVFWGDDDDIRFESIIPGKLTPLGKTLLRGATATFIRSCFVTVLLL